VLPCSMEHYMTYIFNDGEPLQAKCLGHAEAGRTDELGQHSPG
jgi:hypothetical protein